MPLAIDTDYQGVFFDYALDGVRDILTTEYNYGKIYIAPKIIHKDPFQIRIWGTDATTELMVANEWQKEYSIQIVMYFIENTPNEQFYRQMYNDGERLYQLMFNNKQKSITVGSKALKWLDGTISEMVINELEADEEEIEGLNSVSFAFTCKINRDN
jgi:hypothetical protein